jgi:hypothetical protein
MVALIDRSKRELAAVVAAFRFASPAFAQAFNPEDGTGTVLRAVYGPCSGLHTGTVAPQNEQVSGHRSGLHAFDMAASRSGTSSLNYCDPALKGGGSSLG